MSAVVDTPRAKTRPHDSHNPHDVMQQAHDVAEIAANNEGTDLYWGILSLIEKAIEKVERAHSALSVDAYSKELHDKASDELAGLLGVLNAVNTDVKDDGLLHAVETLVIVAKAQIDADNFQAVRASQVAA
ncbi:hypothetical protein EJP67_16455 [Variovorax guangxiensis]|uniref:Uncharacterized protein n=1 Tax=Variovorax guangxiensis TaxID=1775474 RepID=A0A433MLY9_9BURK|nr:hypothetical protein [Variovorax guangxiensis]RUR68655.1 hypothetical protein EJP67_16455 [Variovorax guangxiensis]